MPGIQGIGRWAASVGAVLLCAGWLTGCGGGSEESSSASSLQVGDCVRFASADDGEPSADAVACQDPHYGEVVLSSEAFFAADEALPGETRMTELADTACADALLGYAGLAPVGDGVRMSYLYPTQETWADGDRALTCLAVSVDEETTQLRETSVSIAAG